MPYIDAFMLVCIHVQHMALLHVLYDRGPHVCNDNLTDALQWRILEAEVFRLTGHSTVCLTAVHTNNKETANAHITNPFLPVDSFI